MAMKEIGSKDFEYYENRAVYFDYTHDADDIDFELCYEYMNLDKSIIKTIENRANRTGWKSAPRKT